jgi:hypothetical protein
VIPKRGEGSSKRKIISFILVGFGYGFSTDLSQLKKWFRKE